MKIITIDAHELLKGMSLNDNFSNKGFSPNSLGFEVDRGTSTGVLLPGRSATDYTTGSSGATLGGNVMSSTKYYKAGIGFVYYLVTDNGKIYQTIVSPPVHTLKDTVGSTVFDSCYVYKNNFYATSATNIYRDDTSFSVKDATWWTGTKGKTALTSGVPHKIFEFNGVMYVTNGNKLVSWDDTTANDAAFTLSAGWIITDVLIDNDTIYIAASYSTINSGFNPPTKIFVWNSFTTITWTKEIEFFCSPISAMVKANGSIYLFTGRGLYILNSYLGSFKPLRTLSTSPNYNQVLYFNGNIYFATYQGVGCYNTQFDIYSVPIVYAAYSIASINIGYLDHIDIFNTNSNMYRYIYNTYSGNTFFTNKYDLQNGFIRKMIVCFNGQLPTNSSYTFSIFDESVSSVYSATISNASNGAVTVVPINNISFPKPINYAQLRIAYNNTANIGINFIKIFYEPSETYVSR
jgi:hypothetical protein